MKWLVLSLALASVGTAHAADLNCKGVLEGAPIEIGVVFGEVTAGPGHMPPYSIHATQQAFVTTHLDGVVTQESVVFVQSGGVTRCDWWKKSTTHLLLGGSEPALVLQSHDSWNHSGCGFGPSGVTIKKAGVDVSPTYLKCAE